VRREAAALGTDSMLSCPNVLQAETRRRDVVGLFGLLAGLSAAQAAKAGDAYEVRGMRHSLPLLQNLQQNLRSLLVNQP
jgi:hypothetical protein